MPDPDAYTGPRPRVFVSSIIDGFTDFRRAARQGIEDASAEAVLVNEDFPSLPDSSRNACLNAVETCDAVVAVVGARGGWTAPSGKLAVEEEIEHARRRNVPVLVFLGRGPRDADAERLVVALSDYVDGSFRRTFELPEDLRREVQTALVPMVSQLRRPKVEPRRIMDALAKSPEIPSHPVLRVVISPERDEEVVSPTLLVDRRFATRIYEIGHDQGVRLFDYEGPKRAERRGVWLVVRQDNPRTAGTAVDEVQLEVAENGLIVVDSTLVNRQPGSRGDMLEFLIVRHAAARAKIAATFAFVCRLYDEVDPFKRHVRFAYNVALHRLGVHPFAAESTHTSSRGIPMRTGGDHAVVAHEGARTVTRQVLASPADEIDRTIVVLDRRASGT